MILILGNTSDSLIYVKNMLRYSSDAEEKGGLKTNLGKIYGKDVLVAEVGISNYRSELVAAYLIQKYNPYIVIYIGDGGKISSNISVGDIYLGTNIIISDINMLNYDPSTSLYEVPGFKKELIVQDNLLKSFDEAATKVNVLSPKSGAVISSNTYPADFKALNFQTDEFLADHHCELVYESQAGGIMLACSFYGVPLFPIITVSSDINKPDSMLDGRRTILKNCIDIGKIVVSFIVTLSSDEKTYIRSDFGNDLNKMGK